MTVLENVKEFAIKNLIAIISIIIAILSILFSFIYVKTHECPICSECNMDKEIIENDNEIDSRLTFKIDVKGSVKKPGVYEVDETFTVSDAITLAGGLNSNGVTSNINLSKKVSPEMVIYVFSKSELKEINSKNTIVCEIPKCECESLNVNESICANANEQTKVSENTGNDATNKVSINTNSIDELKTLDGIGDAKAKSIIEYRKTNGDFKAIEDVMRVSGIGSELYEKIKNKIKI